MHENLIEPPLECPTSGVLLGAFVKSFDLNNPAIGGSRAAKHLGSEKSLARSAREYFRGAKLAEPKRKIICHWVVEATLESGLLTGFGLPTDPNGPTPPVDEFLTEIPACWLGDWDAVYCQGASGWLHPPRELGGYVLGRQLVIDLVPRVAAVIQLMGGCQPEAVIPYAGDEKPGRALLHALMESSGRKLTRGGLAGR